MATTVVTIERWHPARLNQYEGRHWSVKARLKKRDRDLVTVSTLLLPKSTCRRRVSLKITIAPRQRTPDPDCFWKSLNDALVCAGLLVDDSSKWLELGSVTFERGPVAATTITLEDLANERLSTRGHRPRKRGTGR